MNPRRFNQPDLVDLQVEAGLGYVRQMVMLGLWSRLMSRPGVSGGFVLWVSRSR
jgi:hypothetical protein